MNSLHDHHFDTSYQVQLWYVVFSLHLSSAVYGFQI